MRKIKTIKLNYEFKNVFKKGKFYFENQIITYVLKNNFGFNRLGIAINSKLCKANKRNRIKRVIRKAYQDVSKEYGLNKENQGFDIVFIWNKKNDIEELDYHTIYNSIVDSFKKAEIIK